MVKCSQRLLSFWISWIRSRPYVFLTGMYVLKSFCLPDQRNNRISFFHRADCNVLLKICCCKEAVLHYVRPVDTLLNFSTPRDLIVRFRNTANKLRKRISFDGDATLFNSILRAVQNVCRPVRHFSHYQQPGPESKSRQYGHNT